MILLVGLVLMAVSGSVAAAPISTRHLVVDHDSVALFEQIPEAYLLAAQNTPMFYMDRSVGGNISDGLTCLSYPSDEAAPNHCKRFLHLDPRYSSDPSEVDWSRTGGYNRDKWVYVYWPDGCGWWYDQIACFFAVAEQQPEARVASFQYSYLEVEAGSSIVDQPGGFFWDNSSRLDVYDLESFEALHPDLTVIYWTTSLARGIGTPEASAFNQQMRSYAAAHDKPLFDVADILSHDPNGAPCYDNRDGVPYPADGSGENHPDDGVDQPAICPHYTTEAEGGHLGAISVGKIRVAKAFWVMMAQLQGWQPGAPPPSGPQIRLPLILRSG